MKAVKTLHQTCVEIAKQKYHNYMGGGNQFDYDYMLIAFIFGIDHKEVISIVNSLFRDMVRGE